MVRLFLIELIILFAIFPGLFAGNKQTSEIQTKVLYFESLIAEIFPVSTDEQIPPEFIPRDSIIKYQVKLKNDRGFYLNIYDEIAIELESPLKTAELLNYYDRIIPAMDWKILQKESRTDVAMILAEGNGKTGLTVVVSDLHDKRKIKIFFKKPSLFE